jgi:hypothetical protein
MSSDLDKLKALKGRKLVDYKLEWDDQLDDYCLAWLKFDDNSYISVFDKKIKPVRWFVEDVEP